MRKASIIPSDDGRDDDKSSNIVLSFFFASSDRQGLGGISLRDLIHRSEIESESFFASMHPAYLLPHFPLFHPPLLTIPLSTTISRRA